MDSNRSQSDTTEATATMRLSATRRSTLRFAGAGALASLGIAGLGGRVTAQEASPVPGPASKVGLYYVSRTRIVKAESSMEEMNAAISEGLAPLLRAIPGFVEYYVVQNDETRERTGVSIFTDKMGTDESTRVVGAYLQDFADFYEDVEPIIQEGSIVFAAT